MTLMMKENHDWKWLPPLKLKIRVDWTTAEIIHALAITALSSVAEEILRPQRLLSPLNICKLRGTTNGPPSGGGFPKRTQVQNID